MPLLEQVAQEWYMYVLPNRVIKWLKAILLNSEQLNTE